MLHEIGPQTLLNAYVARLPKADDTVLCYCAESILVAEGEPVAFPSVAALSVSCEQLEYLYTIGEEAFYLCSMLDEIALPGYVWVEVRSLRNRMPLHLAYAGILGQHLYRWYLTRRYCGNCGTPTSRDLKERMIICNNCGMKEYPGIMPAVIVGVIRGDQLLMTKYANRPNANWALVAGYCEIGETLEETVAREVMEETGLRIRNITYYKSQPWPFSGSLLAGFFAQAADDSPITLDETELAEAAFVPRDEIDVPYEGRALTNEMICFFRDHGPKAALRQDPMRQQPYVRPQG